MNQSTMNGQTVLITGASKGIGAAIAERFASMNTQMNIVLHYYQSHDAVNDIAERCRHYGAHVHTISADLRSLEELKVMKQTLESMQVYPDILVNNAGVSHYGLLSVVSEDIWDNLMSINLKGTFLCTQLFMSHMVQQKYGRIINISSIWGLTGASCEVAYATSKGGIHAFTKSLAKELAPSFITVNAVAPGAVHTAMMKDFTAEERKSLEEQIPMGRLATPQEIASLVYYLALPESAYMTGQVLSPNGGWVT